MADNSKSMRYEEIENPRWRDTLDALNPPPLPPEPIYDLTTSDKTKLVKAAGPIERGENP
ncbi:MAG: hypothetical protein M3258_07595 [Thermoproteota archaeon]|nr:hypothetical protein [Thermoproteota archaeon]